MVWNPERAVWEMWNDRRYFTLDDENRVVGPVTIEEWAAWMARRQHKRHVGDTETQLFRVSTVFLGLDMRFGGKGPPLLFETMVFEREGHPSKLVPGLEVHAELEGYQRRYASWDDAAAGHDATLKRVLKLEADALARATRPPS